ncbi:MAG: 2-succinyl-5-enolpyruvyl-6-hydroxy-3-cyclohexene-1-carboxylic-acid synthase [Scytolyngbya sp. HA4215-MV1]|jgi:2-succinyl-5-enolpyruvyl-6-hydroxy-3-cyclohexene-1-carboxylate synthase|nr:2-succinyl-5-enolpyruvyl-6-hydroxy-3-cyclohexene-1-carboxylic-acid synthase [Scytolyngbya sp. HA4215-MV1]
MPIDFSNTNTVWASILAETLKRLGLATVIICPGSRSAPLAVAFAQLEGVEAIPVLDERSAAFFALGLARQTHAPVALVCTSGTAGANFYPAIIEARESRVPLLILTADRPPELRHCNAGQTIDQQKMFGSFPNRYAELALPSLEAGMLAYLRQTLIQSWEQTLYPVPGPVHLNIPFRDPLIPIRQPEAQSLAPHFHPETFFSHLSPPFPFSLFPLPSSSFPPVALPASPRGILIAGTAQPLCAKTYCHAIAHLSKTLGLPVLADGLSPLRNYASLNPYLISTYDLLLRNHVLAESLQPEWVIRIGEMPTSKELRSWLEVTQPQQWIIDPTGRNLDPLHGNTLHLRLTVEQVAEQVVPVVDRDFTYLNIWLTAEQQTRQQVDRVMTDLDYLFEGKIAWLLSQVLPPQTPLFISSSMPVRDVEFFWTSNDRQISPFFNRGANGIDGSLSTALGMAHRNQSGVMLTGDLALLHDTNGFLLRNHFTGHLTIVLINNNGGGIFEMLPISGFDPPFESFFATPQNINFADLCKTYHIQHEQITDWQQLKQRLNPLPETGIRVLEVQTDRKRDAQWRQMNLSKLGRSTL